jgi:hypothetical protein
MLWKRGRGMPRSLFQRVEIRDDILSVGAARNADEHFRPVHGARGARQKPVERGVVPSDVRSLHGRGIAVPSCRPALAPDDTRQRWTDLVLARRRRMTACAFRKDLLPRRRISAGKARGRAHNQRHGSEGCRSSRNRCFKSHGPTSIRRLARMLFVRSQRI